jgi:hypothetical protein
MGCRGRRSTCWRICAKRGSAEQRAPKYPLPQADWWCRPSGAGLRAGGERVGADLRVERRATNGRREVPPGKRGAVARQNHPAHEDGDMRHPKHLQREVRREDVIPHCKRVDQAVRVPVIVEALDPRGIRAVDARVNTGEEHQSRDQVGKHRHHSRGKSGPSRTSMSSVIIRKPLEEARQHLRARRRDVALLVRRDHAGDLRPTAVAARRSWPPPTEPRRRAWGCFPSDAPGFRRCRCRGDRHSTL